MFVPDLIINSVFELTEDILHKLGINAIILDVDNTLRAQGTLSPYKGVLEWIETMKRADIKMTIASNNFSANVAPFAKKLNLDFVSMSCKPLPIGLKKAVNKFGLDKKQVAIVGDQIFTDILGGKLTGITSILVFPFVKEPGIAWKFKRFMERPAIKAYYRKNKEDINDS